jgi:hypothetical protein
MSLGNQSHCFRGLNGRATLCRAVNSPQLDGVSPYHFPVLNDNSGERARLACWRRCLSFADFWEDCFGETPKPAREARALPGNWSVRAIFWGAQAASL